VPNADELASNLVIEAKKVGIRHIVKQSVMGHGFLEISLTHNGRNLTGIFYSNDDGSIEDTFTIIK